MFTTTTEAQTIQHRAETVCNRRMQATGTFEGFTPAEWTWIHMPQTAARTAVRGH